MPLLFIHGFATGPAVWDYQIKEFSKDYEVITDPERIKERVIVIGWSMGGWKALELYLEYPQKVIGLVLVSAFAKYLRSDDYPCGTSPALLRKLERKFRADYRGGLRYFYDLVFRNKEWHGLAEKLPIPEKKDIDRWFEKLKKEDKRKILPQIEVPTLLIHGSEDQVALAESSKYLHDNIRGSELHVLEGAGHAPMVEASGLFNSLLREFVTRHAG